MTKNRSRRSPNAPIVKKGFQIVGPVEDVEEKKIEMVIGGQNVVIYRMNVGSLQALVKLTERYIKSAVMALVSQAGLESLGDQDAMKKALRNIISEQLSEMVVTVPETLVQACACLMNIRPEDEDYLEWFTSSVLPSEVLDIIPQLDELNDFGKLWDDGVALWQHFNKKYSIGEAVAGQLAAQTQGD